MRQPHVLLTSLLAVQVTAQSFDFGSFLSIGISAFTSFTASLGGQTTATAPVATTTSDSNPTDSSTNLFSSVLTSSASTTPTATSTTARQTTTSRGSSATSSSLSSSSITSSPTITSQTTTSRTSSSSTASHSSSTSSAASNAASNQGSNSGSNHDRTLAIVLGCVLGALALGLFLLLLLILFNRRRRRRQVAGTTSLTSSDEALAGHQHSKSRKVPIVAAFTHRAGSLGRKKRTGAPLMSERSQYDVPSPYEFREGGAPFVPGTAAGGTKPAGILRNSTANGVTQPHPQREMTGLNSNPYHDGHHAGSMLAAGAGGAALGAAAARRHSRSNERRNDAGFTEEPLVHPAYLDEPPPRSSKRSSVDSARRRSGSMPPGTFYGPTDHANSPLRNGVTAAAAGGTVGAAAGAIAGQSGRRSHDRGRPVTTDVLPHDDQQPGRATDALLGTSPETRRSGEYGRPHEASTMQTLTGGHNNHNSTNNRASAPALGAAALGAGAAAGLASHRRSSPSKSKTYPPLPPSLTIPDPNKRRSTLNRSPKRTRFSDGNTYHELAPEDERRSEAISPPTASKTNSWASQFNPSMADTYGTDELVSPISPDYSTTARHSIGHGVPVQSSRANLVNVARSRSVSPDRRVLDQRPGFTPPLDHFPTPPNPVQSENPRLAQRTEPIPATSTHRPQRDSGLVNAVQGHFDPDPAFTTSPTTMTESRHRTQPHSESQTYQAYSRRDPVQPPIQRHGHDTIPANISRRQSQPISRKPVPHSRYAKPLPQAPGSSNMGSMRPGNPWQGYEEDSNWSNNYADGYEPGYGYSGYGYGHGHGHGHDDVGRAR